MKKASFISGFVILSIAQLAWASDGIAFSAKQVQVLGITTAALPSKQSGEISGLPAQVVNFPNQMFVISTPLPAMIEQTLVGVGDSDRKGQQIARLQSPALDETQRVLLQASVQRQVAKKNLARDEALWKDGITTESRFLATKGASLETPEALAPRVLELQGAAE